jgi:hypothetical protein
MTCCFAGLTAGSKPTNPSWRSKRVLLVLLRESWLRSLGSPFIGSANQLGSLDAVGGRLKRNAKAAFAVVSQHAGCVYGIALGGGKLRFRKAGSHLEPPKLLVFCTSFDASIAKTERRY